MKENKNVVAEISVIYRDKAPVRKKPIIKKSKDIYSLILPYFRDFINHHEEFWIILTDNQGGVLAVSKIAQGGITGTTVDIRIIFQAALHANAISIGLVHNHPSGNLKPSPQDELTTKKIIQAGNVLDIRVIDHLIISEEDYLSFADENML